MTSLRLVALVLLAWTGCAHSGAPGHGDLRIELPCDRRHGPAASRSCFVTKEVDKQTRELTLGGKAGIVYEVTLRIRGLVEPMRYEGGTRQHWWYAGGEPKDKWYNVYKLQIADPPRHYFLNAGAPPTLDHDLYPLDYHATIKVKGGAKVTFSADGQNASIIDNTFYKKVEGVPPFPAPFPGQFVQIDIVSVTPPF